MSRVVDIIENTVHTDGSGLGNEISTLTTKRNTSITYNITVDSDYTLTGDQNLYGRINITDTGVILTTARNIIVDNVEKNSFIFQNSTAQDLTVKTSAGTGILVSSGETKVLRNDGTNVLDSDFATETPSLGVGQTWQDLTASRSDSTNYTNTTGKPISISVLESTSNATHSITVDGIVVSRWVDGGGFAGQATTSAIIPDGSTYSHVGGFDFWLELR